MCIQNVELSGHTRAAPFILRPFAGLFNPYPYGCSVLCNHPADCEAKQVLRRAKDTWVRAIDFILSDKIVSYKVCWGDAIDIEMSRPHVSSYCSGCV